MAKVMLNPVLEKVRGKIGDLVFKRYHDEVIMSRTPDMSGNTPTPGQTAHRERFRLAVLYGNTVLADPAKRSIYEAAAKGKGLPAFAVTVGDFLKAPSVEEIDLSGYTGQMGETIRVIASDDFEVAGVAVNIMRADGTVIEQGGATPSGNDSSWSYTTTAALPAGQNVSIEVTATDRPGNKGTKTQTKSS